MLKKVLAFIEESVIIISKHKKRKLKKQFKPFVFYRLGLGGNGRIGNPRKRFKMTKQEFLKNEVKELKRFGKKFFGKSTRKVDQLIELDLSVIKER